MSFNLNLTPVLFKDKLNEDKLNFTIGNIGLNIDFGISRISSCIAVYVTPIILNTSTNSEEWLLKEDETREYCVPVKEKESLLYFVRKEYDSIQWSKNTVKVFWGREVFKLWLEKNDKEEYILYFKKLYWDGKSMDSRNNIRLTYDLNKNIGYDYLLNITNDLTINDYLSLSDDECQNLLLKKEKEMTHTKKKSKLNKYLNKIGLQLIEK